MGRVVAKGPSERDRGDNETGDAEHGTESVKVAAKGELVPGGGDRVGCGERGESGSCCGHDERARPIRPARLAVTGRRMVRAATQLTASMMNAVCMSQPCRPISYSLTMRDVGERSGLMTCSAASTTRNPVPQRW